MWKKDEEKPATEQKEEIRPSRSGPPRRTGSAGEEATIGPSISINGEVSGDEDLLIQGTVEGTVDLDQNSVTVGGEGRVKGNITGRVVIVEGEVEGDLTAEEQIVLRSSARVNGDITAPRVVLDDGASLRGLVDMGKPSGGDGKPKKGKQTFGDRTENRVEKTGTAASDSPSPPSGESTPPGSPPGAKSSVSPS